MRPMLNTAVKAARQAGQTILKSLDHLESIQVKEKQRNDFVTEVDRAVEQEIVELLKQTYPDHSILGEESGEQVGDDYRWLIDPIDGTTNFIHGLPHFAVSIALQYKGKTEVGVVYDPLRQELFTAVRGEGTRLDDKRIRVAEGKRLEHALIGTGFPLKRQNHLPAYLASFSTIFSECSGIRRAGAASLDLAYVASGRLDGFWEFFLEPWDMAAGLLLVKEAGGIVSDFSAKSESLNNGQVIAGSPKIYKALLNHVQAAIAD